MTNKSSIYTRTGDLGTTALIGGTRVKKHHPRVEAYGTIDELNSQIGLLIATEYAGKETEELRFLEWTQLKLFDLGAYLATDNNGAMIEDPSFGQATISRVEHEIDRMDAELPALRAFILPGGTISAAIANVCRTICRRAERQIIGLNENIWIDPNVIRYINRLSDYFFVLGRYINHQSGTTEYEWRKEK